MGSEMERANASLYPLNYILENFLAADQRFPGFTGIVKQKNNLM